MPTYEYLCTSCGHEWELEQSIKEDPLKVCQKCAQETAQRQISRGVGFILKGGGWYADLYSSSSNKEPANNKDSSNKDSSKETKSESSGTTSGTSDTKASSSPSSSSSKSETAAAATS